MGWLWTCIRGEKTNQAHRIQSRGRVSSHTPQFRLPVQLSGRSPIGEEYLQKRGAGFISSLSGDLGDLEIIKGSDTPSKGIFANSLSKGSDGKSRRNLRAHVDELEEELSMLRRKLAAEAEEAEKLREEVSYLRSCGIDDLDRRGKSLERERLIPNGENIGEDWNPYWGYVSETKAQSPEDPTALRTRKSFSELLLEPDSSDENSRPSKGALALNGEPDIEKLLFALNRAATAAAAAAAERAARNQYGGQPFRSQGESAISKSHHNGNAPKSYGGKWSTTRESGRNAAEGRGSLVSMLMRENESISQQQQQLLLDVAQPSSGGKPWHSGVTSQQGKSEAEGPEIPYVTMSTMDGGEALDIEWIEMRNGPDPSNSSTIMQVAKDDARIPRTSGFLLKVTAEALAKDLQRAGKRHLKRSGNQEPYEKRPRSPQLNQYSPKLSGSNDSLLAEHNASQMTDAVAAFKEGRLELHLKEGSMHHFVPRVSLSSNMSITSLFRSSRKRSLALRSRAFRRPLSPVPEALSLDEGSWSRQGSRKGDDILSEDSKQLSNNVRPALTESPKEPDEGDTASEDASTSEENESNDKDNKSSQAAQTGSRKPSFLFRSIDSTSASNSDKENQEHERLPPINCSSASYVAMPRPSRRRQSSSKVKAHTTRWTVSPDNIDLHPSNDRSWYPKNFGINQSHKESQNHEADARGVSGSLSTREQYPDAHETLVEGLKLVTEPKGHSSNPEEQESGRRSFSRYIFEEEDQMAARPGEEVSTQQQSGDGSELLDPQAAKQEGSKQSEETKEPEDYQYGLTVFHQIQLWNSLQKAPASKEVSRTSLSQPEDTNAQSVKMWDSLHKAASSNYSPTTTVTQLRSSSFKSARAPVNRATGSCKSDSSIEVRTVWTEGDSSTEDEAPGSSSSSNTVGADSFQDTYSPSLSFRDMPTGGETEELTKHEVSSDEQNSHRKSQPAGDNSEWRTPLRPALVSPEIFISPNGTRREVTFTRLLDISPEERPIFGSVAGHWEAAWSTKRQGWDGKGIPNSTNKYKEDQKVAFHATPFEERLEQALASQAEVPPRTLFSVIGNLPGRSGGEGRYLEMHKMNNNSGTSLPFKRISFV